VSDSHVGFGIRVLLEIRVWSCAGLLLCCNESAVSSWFLMNGRVCFVQVELGFPWR
jgi:hypothetical protein